MGQMSEYIVVNSVSRQGLVDQVNARLKEGYVLIGGVALDPINKILAQAMAK